MCKLGDIIVIKRHSFVVINDEGNSIEGLKYDFVSNMMCSFHDEEHRRRKLSFKQNLPLEQDAVLAIYGNNKKGFIKADQLYYFSKSKIKYYIVGQINPKMLNKLLKLIIILMDDGKETKVITNLK